MNTRPQAVRNSEPRGEMWYDLLWQKWVCVTECRILIVFIFVQQLTEVLQIPKDQPDQRERREMTVRHASHTLVLLSPVCNHLQFVIYSFSLCSRQESQFIETKRDTKKRGKRKHWRWEGEMKTEHLLKTNICLV